MWGLPVFTLGAVVSRDGPRVDMTELLSENL
jgi:hypothetical protein